MSKKQDDSTRRDQIFEVVLEVLSEKNQLTEPMKKLFSSKKNKLEEIIEYIYDIFWEEKFNPNDKAVAKKIKDYIEIEIKANSK
mgnify:CR=1 FL=1|tara:strand:- start:313 stop:564 length:252 start_codon:yes stop_codon:yes gene_type:complete